MDTFQITALNGDIYEATRPSPADPWTITFPTGETRFFGTKAETRAEIADLIALHGARRRTRARPVTHGVAG